MFDVLRICSPCFKWAACPGDSQLTELRKQMLFVLACVTGVVLCASVAYSIEVSAYGFLFIGACFGFTATGLILYHLFVKKQVTEKFIVFVLWLYAIAICLSDLNALNSSNPRLWPISVLLVDLMLVLRVADHYAVTLMCLGASWLLFTEFVMHAQPEVFKYGQYPFDERNKICACGDAPCALERWSDLPGGFLSTTMVFVLDFIFTRGFAREVLSQKSKAEAAAEAAKAIASSIAVFDLDSATVMLDEKEASMHSELHASLHQILRMLRCYRPYLPDGLVEEMMQNSQVHEDSTPEAPPPGLAGESTAVVFTDIKSSSEIWSSAPDAMKRALKQHNAALRTCINKYHGYEVKTIGDAFMVAFASASDAVAFGLAVHEALLCEAWPPALLQLPLCARDASGLWGGLTLRVGVHYGDLSAQMNKVVGRFDYFGNAVNIAARVESICRPGHVAITQAVLDALADEDEAPSPLASRMLLKVGDTACYVRDQGRVVLRGIPTPTQVFALVPEALQARMLSSQFEEKVQGRAGGSSAGTTPRSQQSLSASLLSMSLRRPADEERLKLRTLHSVSSATVGVAKLSVPTSAAGEVATACFNNFLQTLVTALDRSEGRMSSVMGTDALVSWNTGHGADRHIELSFRFAAFLFRDTHETPCAVGLATGPARHGFVGTSAQRFATITGAALAGASALAWHAAHAGQLCLFASLTTRVEEWPSELQALLCPANEVEIEGKPNMTYTLVPRTRHPPPAIRNPSVELL